MFLESFDETVIHYRDKVASSTGRHVNLSNIDWDTGNKTAQREYVLADKTYSDWVIKLKEKKFETIDPSMKNNILGFYRNYHGSGVGDEQWQQTAAALSELRNGD